MLKAFFVRMDGIGCDKLNFRFEEIPPQEEFLSGKFLKIFENIKFIKISLSCSLFWKFALDRDLKLLTFLRRDEDINYLETLVEKPQR